MGLPLGSAFLAAKRYCWKRGKIDQEAFKRATSVYFPDHVLPMLPVSLSNGICSLNPNEDRFTMAVEMVLDGKGKVLDYEIHKGIMRSSYRMTYTNVTKILNGDKKLSAEYKDIVPMLSEAFRIAHQAPMGPVVISVVRSLLVETFETEILEKK